MLLVLCVCFPTYNIRATTSERGVNVKYKNRDIKVIYGSDVENLTKNKSSVYYKKLEKDKIKDNTPVPNEIEMVLNSLGVGDESINSLPEKAIEDISNAKEILVQVDFWGINDKGKINELNEEEVNSLFEDDIHMKDSEEEDIFDNNILQTLGLIPKTTIAKEYESEERISSSGALRRIIVCTQSKSGADINIWLTNQWMKEAKYRNIDVVGFVTNDMKLRTDTKYRSCSHRATEVKYVNGKLMHEQKRQRQQRAQSMQEVL